MLEVRAYDPSNNLVSQTFKVIIYPRGTHAFLASGVNQFEIVPADTDDFSVDISLDLLDAMAIIFSSSQSNPSLIDLSNGLLFIELNLDDAGKVNQLNITITFLRSEGLEHLRGWWFNETSNAWQEIPILVEGNVIFLSVDHASIFALSGNVISAEREAPNLIVIIIFSMIGGAMVVSSAGIYITRKKKQKAAKIPDLKKKKLRSAEQYKTPSEIDGEMPLDRKKLESKKIKSADIKKKDIPAAQTKEVKRTKPQDQAEPRKLKRDVKSDAVHKKARKLKEADEERPKEITEAEKMELQKTEEEVDLEESKFKCVVHRGEIVGNIYLCPKCRAFYCDRCAKVLKLNGEKCWSCDFDIKITVTEQDKATLMETKTPEKTDTMVKEQPQVDEYLTTSKTLDDFPELKTHVINILTEEELAKIDELTLSDEEKNQFLQELLLLNPEERKDLLEEMLEQQE